MNDYFFLSFLRQKGGKYGFAESILPDKINTTKSEMKTIAKSPPMDVPSDSDSGSDLDMDAESHGWITLMHY